MKIPVLHQTDLFHPHNDPDDHWDLACVYALAYRGDFDLKAILIDHPPANHPGVPDVMAVSQLNSITGLNVPVMVGTSLSVKSFDDLMSKNNEAELSGVQSVIELLRNSPAPVVIFIVGSCKDIAIAAAREPELFKEKCKALYLNAGTSSRHPAANDPVEYNVLLNAAAYSSLFKLKCPIYWMPCFEDMKAQIEQQSIMEFGTYYKFRQDMILPYISDRLRNYFYYMLTKSQDPDVLGYLTKPPDEQAVEFFGQQLRYMWCTGGFLHAAGYAVTREGAILPHTETSGNEAFTFDPIEVKCDGNGKTRWVFKKSSEDRFIFHVRDIKCYCRAMTTAMRTLLEELP
jgi:hypothetical protein